MNAERPASTLRESQRRATMRAALAPLANALLDEDVGPDDLDLSMLDEAGRWIADEVRARRMREVRRVDRELLGDSP